MKRAITATLLLVFLSMDVAYALTDPTRPANFNVKGVDAKTAYVLSGIINRKNRKLAIINGNLVKLGEVILDARVIAINDDSVHLDSPNGKLILFLNGQSVKSVGKFMCKREFKLCEGVSN